MEVTYGVHTIIDIGGQDTMAIAIGENGDVSRFLMNDKCAAGTGRFLEVMARTLEIDLEDFGDKALQGKSETIISSMMQKTLLRCYQVPLLI
jgi:activator of 2-hydroxyglutaryl-CoA dehydratase